MLLLLLGLTGLNLHLKATQHTLQQCDKSQDIGGWAHGTNSKQEKN